MKIASLFATTLLVGASAVACPTGTTAVANEVLNGKAVCSIGQTDANTFATLSGNINLTNNYSYKLMGDVRIGGDNANQGILTVDAGTVVYGTQGSALIINRGSQIFANGTAQAPVVFTSINSAPESTVAAQPGDWGGLTIIGNAVVNTCAPDAANPASCTNQIEGIDPKRAPMFGGQNDDDNSGSLTYVRSEYAGTILFADSELNSITFYAVGRGTNVEFIEAYRGNDDGVEIFGGTVNIKYVAIIDSDDDGLDWDMGWRGNAQFVYISVQNGKEKDTGGIEADNYKGGPDLLPRSNPTISNVTVVGLGHGEALLNGVVLRNGTHAKIYNSTISGHFKTCLNVDGEATYNAGLTKDVNGQTGLMIQNSVISCDQTIFGQEADAFAWSIEGWFNAQDMNNYVMDPQLKGLNPDSGSPLLDTGMFPPDDAFFLPVDYVGAFSGDVSENWTAGWAVL